MRVHIDDDGSISLLTDTHWRTYRDVRAAARKYIEWMQGRDVHSEWWEDDVFDESGVTYHPSGVICILLGMGAPSDASEEHAKFFARVGEAFPWADHDYLNRCCNDFWRE